MIFFWKQEERERGFPTLRTLLGSVRQTADDDAGEEAWAFSVAAVPSTGSYR